MRGKHRSCYKAFSLLPEELDLATLRGLVKELVIDPHHSNYNSFAYPFRVCTRTDNDD